LTCSGGGAGLAFCDGLCRTALWDTPFHVPDHRLSTCTTTGDRSLQKLDCASPGPGPAREREVPGGGGKRETPGGGGGQKGTSWFFPRWKVCVHLHTYVIMSASMYDCGYICMPACLHVCTYVCLFVCSYVCMDGFIDGWTDGCVNACVHVCMVASLYHAFTHGRAYACMQVCTWGERKPRPSALRGASPLSPGPLGAEKQNNEPQS
jgi:hypothetical protein